MRAISIRQPYAWAIMHGGKDVENRRIPTAWRAGIGQRVAIHAAKLDHATPDQPVLDAVAAAGDWEDHRSAIIGTVLLVDVHPANGCCAPWGHPYRLEQADGYQRALYDVCHLVLTDPVPCPPIPTQGKLGLWHLPEHLAAAVESYSRVDLAHCGVEV